jgi:phosphoribulokinase
MSNRNPIISVAGSSGGGTTSVRNICAQIFRCKKVKAVYIEGDCFHRYNRYEMPRAMAEATAKGDHRFSHFGEEANLLQESKFRFVPRDLRPAHPRGTPSS